MFSYKERFFGSQKGGSNYAPMTIGSPEYISQVDYKVFKKEDSEKLQLAVIKAQHKRELIKSYGKGNTNRKMNPLDGVPFID